MPNSPTISVVITSYNREKFLGDSIESVLAQTFQDFEIVIVDDRSDDKSPDIAQEYARRDSRIRVFANETNLGQFGNRNHAARLAAGRFIKYHDSDDLMYPHCLETFVSALDCEPRAGFALMSGWNWPGGPCPMFLTPRMCYQREFLGSGMFFLGPSCALFRKEVLQELGGFPNVGVGSDQVFWLTACSQHSAVLVPGDLFWYRIHHDQELQSSRARNDYVLSLKYTWEALNSLNCPLESGEREQAKRNWTYSIVRRICRNLRGMRWLAAGQTFIHSGLSLWDWLHYLRPSRRDHIAGTPFDERGDFITPDWLRPQAILHREYCKSV